jgi:hypothetical protein
VRLRQKVNGHEIALATPPPSQPYYTHTCTHRCTHKDTCAHTHIHAHTYPHKEMHTRTPSSRSSKETTFFYSCLAPSGPHFTLEDARTHVTSLGFQTAFIYLRFSFPSTGIFGFCFFKLLDCLHQCFTNT